MKPFARWSVLLLLMALRLPSLLQPAGADQSLYAYVGLTILEGGTPYVDAWDQKPPGIHLLYALLWWLWPDERVVNVADLIAAAGVCWLLVVLGRRVATTGVGWLAACVFALLANPSMHRLSGVYIRSQCETFIALAVTAAIVLVTARHRRWPAALGAGALIGAAIWLKYNAIVFALPVFVAAYFWPRAEGSRFHFLQEAFLIGTGATLVGAVGLAWMISRGAMGDLWLATIDYNVAYSSSGFGGALDVVRYLIDMPIRQAQRELLWLAGLAGVALAMALPVSRRPGVLCGTWITCAIVAITINGRDLPQYFVQATPALALSGAVGMWSAWHSRRLLLRSTVVALLVAGFWRVGFETPVFGIARLAGLPGLVDNLRFDMAYWRASIDRPTYLDRFGGQRERDKFAARDVEELASTVATLSQPGQPILVFGFSPAVYLKADRRSASRFFWSYPVVTEFAASRPGYGSKGLLDDLGNSPAVVVLQKGDWAPVDSAEFFRQNDALSSWLQSQYRQVGESRRYLIWVRSTGGTAVIHDN